MAGIDETRIRRILLAGEPSIRSAPTLSLAKALTEFDITTEHASGAERRSGTNWWKLVGRNDALVLVTYERPDFLLQRHLHTARLRGCITVRWWVGSDVLYCLRSTRMAEAARSLDRALDLNLAAAPHLVNELGTLGIRSSYVPSIYRPPKTSPPPPSLPPAVLAYLPTGRGDFYGADAVRQAVEANQDLEFIIIGDDSHALRSHPNVRSLGWVDNLDDVWPSIGVLMRITKHDGLPRMILEALSRHRQVIYAWPLAGCRQARTHQEIQVHLDEFKIMRSPNLDGPATAHKLAGDAASRFLDAIRAAGQARAGATRAGALIGMLQNQAFRVIDKFADRQ